MKTFVGILLLAAVVQGFTPSSWYKCPSSCKSATCRCASGNPPLPLSETPIFVLITNDDSIDKSVASRMNQITSSGKNRNGCPIPVTWFANAQYTECGVAKQRYNMGDEIAIHNYHHKQLNPNTKNSVFVKEILGCRDFFVNKCGIPKSSIKGYRSTYLVSNPETRKFVADNGFAYDSSITYDEAKENSRPWPYTMNYGNPDPSCSHCPKNEKEPGFYEVPVWPIRYDGQMYPMDPGMKVDWENAKERPVYDVLKHALDVSMKSNKAPVGMYVHEYWITPKHIDGAKKFIKYATSKPDVYFVTMSQLVEWMKNPVPKSQMAAWLKSRCG